MNRIYAIKCNEYYKLAVTLDSSSPFTLSYKMRELLKEKNFSGDWYELNLPKK